MLGVMYNQLYELILQNCIYLHFTFIWIGLNHLPGGLIYAHGYDVEDLSIYLMVHHVTIETNSKARFTNMD